MTLPDRVIRKLSVPDFLARLRAAGGSPDGVVCLIYERFKSYVRVLVRARGVHRNDWSDVSQDVWTRISRAIQSLVIDSYDELRSWIGTVTRNCCNDWHRRSGRIREVSVEESDRTQWEEALTARTETTLERLLAREREQSISAAVALLTPA